MNHTTPIPRSRAAAGSATARLTLLLGSVVTVAIGCSVADPVPNEVVAGTTVSLAIDSLPGFATSAPQLSIEDVQRGGIDLRVCPVGASGESRIDGQGLCPSGELLLPVRLATRVAPAQSSRLALGLSARQQEIQNIARESTQPVVLVDIPIDAEGVYDVFQQGVPRGQFTDRRIISVRPASLDGSGMPVPQYSDLTDLTLGGLSPGDYRDIIPMPQLSLELEDTSPSLLPRAAEVIVSYPAQLVTPLAAVRPTDIAVGSYSAITTIGLGSGRVKLMFATPSSAAAERDTRLNLVFELNEGVSAPVPLSAFSIESDVLYDENGVEITTNAYVLSRIY